MTDNNAATPMLAAMIIDRSGSMAHLTEATISGFNEYLQDRKRENPSALMSLTLFNTELDVRYVARPVGGIPELTRATYQADGGTALNDAIGLTIKQIEKAGYDKLAKILVTIITDGMENSSKQFTREDVARLIAQKEEFGWKFVYFGANVDVELEASSRNIHASRRANFVVSPSGTLDAFQRHSRATRSFAAGNADEVWTAELREQR